MTEKRSVSLAGHRTSVALEPEFWAAVDRLAQLRGQSLAGFVAHVDRNRKGKNLASALRLTVLLDLESRYGALQRQMTAVRDSHDGTRTEMIARA